MCDARGFGFLAVLVWNKVSILIILVWNRYGFVHSSLELEVHYAPCFIVWNIKLETLYSFVSHLIKAYKHCLIIRQVWSQVWNRVGKITDLGLRLGKGFRKRTAHPRPIFLEVHPPGSQFNYVWLHFNTNGVNH